MADYMKRLREDWWEAVPHETEVFGEMAVAWWTGRIAEELTAAGYADAAEYLGAKCRSAKSLHDIAGTYSTDAGLVS